MFQKPCYNLKGPLTSKGIVYKFTEGDVPPYQILGFPCLSVDTYFHN